MDGLSKLNSVDVEVDVFQASAGTGRPREAIGQPPRRRSPEGRTAEAAKQYCTPTGVRAPVFPRKEVIQPQLPLRLPCYDFTPITDPTFDGSPPCGLGHRLRVLPAFVV